MYNRRKIATIVFGLILFSIPFNGIFVAPLGELQSELILIPFVFGLVWLILRGRILSWLSTQEITFVCLFTLVILLSLFANSTVIEVASFRERTGLEKFLTSFAVVVFGFTLMRVTILLIIDIGFDQIFSSMALYVFALTIIMFAVGVFEFLTWFFPGFRSWYLFLGDFLFSGQGYDYIPRRLRSVSFEPPALAASLGFLLTFSIGGIMETKGTSQKFYAGSILMMVVMMILSASALAILILLTLSIGLILIRNKIAQLMITTMFVLVFSVFALFLFNIELSEKILLSIIDFRSSSDITRSSSLVAGGRAFNENLIFGVGLGQYGFHAQGMTPSWGYWAWEVRDYFSNPKAPWPPIYSLSARVFVELGIIGAIVWFGSLFFNLVTVFKPGRPLVVSNGSKIFLALAFIYIFAISMSVGSFKFPGIWITLGFAYAFSSEMRRVAQEV